MYVGFHDDPNFRYETRRAEMLDQVRSTRTPRSSARSSTWPNIAPTRPANAADPFDSAYHFQDLDEFVRNTQERDMEVLITIWGTPKWANGGKTPNYAPTKTADLTAFARAVASRYSGRFSGYPFVRFYSVWNESNLQLFLAPQFDAKGKSVAPRTYAKLAAAGVRGHQGGQSKRQGRCRRAPRRRAATSRSPASPPRTRRDASHSSSPQRTRGSSSTRGRSTPIRCRRTRSRCRR